MRSSCPRCSWLSAFTAVVTILSAACGGTPAKGESTSPATSGVANGETASSKLPPGDVSFCGRTYGPEEREAECDDKELNDLKPLAGLSDLEFLEVNGSQVHDLAPLAGLSKLRWLHLDSTQVHDLGPLADLSNLEYLRVGGTQVSDLKPLAGLSRLEWLDISDTQVTARQAHWIAEQLPHCHVSEL